MCILWIDIGFIQDFKTSLHREYVQLLLVLGKLCTGLYTVRKFQWGASRFGFCIPSLTACHSSQWLWHTPNRPQTFCPCTLVPTGHFTILSKNIFVDLSWQLNLWLLRNRVRVDQMIMSATVHTHCVNITDLTVLTDTHGWAAKRNAGIKGVERRRSTEGNTVVEKSVLFSLDIFEKNYKLEWDVSIFSGCCVSASVQPTLCMWILSQWLWLCSL